MTHKRDTKSDIDNAMISVTWEGAGKEERMRKKTAVRSMREGKETGKET